MADLERLAPHHDVAGFSSGNDDLDEWLTTAAGTADRAGTARVYALSEGTTVLGYFATVPHTVRRAEVPGSVGRGSPDVIPGFLLARLAVSIDLQGQGRGGELLVMALETMLGAIRAAGGRILVVDAIDDNAVAFYRHHGFKALPDNPDRLFVKASSAAKSLGVPWP